MKEPFYGLFLMMVNKEFGSEVETLGVYRQGINIGLKINKDFFDSLTDTWRIGLLKHEVLHICFFHIEEAFKYMDHKIANIAMDIEVNQYIEDDYLPSKNVPLAVHQEKYDSVVKDIYDRFRDGKITREQLQKELLTIPPRGMYYEDFLAEDPNLLPKAGVRYYYEWLKNKASKKPGESGYSKRLDDLVNQSGFEIRLAHDWENTENLSEVEKHLIKKQIDTLLQEAANQVGRGLVPGRIADYIDLLNQKQPEKFNWRAYIRRFSGMGVKTTTKKLRRKFNKRFEDNPGLKIKRHKKILVAVDTSGSVSNEELIEFFHEINHMMKSGTTVTVLQCDAAISHVQTYTKKFTGKIALHGRGGTSFDPPVEYFNQHKKEYGCMFYLTDGEAPAPSTNVQGHILWVLSERARNYDHLKPSIKLN